MGGKRPKTQDQRHKTGFVARDSGFAALPGYVKNYAVVNAVTPANNVRVQASRDSIFATKSQRHKELFLPQISQMNTDFSPLLRRPLRMVSLSNQKKKKGHRELQPQIRRRFTLYLLGYVFSTNLAF